jgi:hypothetical protein
MMNALFIKEIIVTPNNTLKNICCKNSVDLELKVFYFHHMFSFPLHFFMINDSNKVIHTITQDMHSEICQFFFQTYNYGNITQKRKNVSTYNHQHGTFMKIHTLANHQNA